MRLEVLLEVIACSVGQHGYRSMRLVNDAMLWAALRALLTQPRGSLRSSATRFVRALLKTTPSYSLLTTHYLPLTTYHLPLTTDHLPLTTDYLLPGTRPPQDHTILLTTHYSLLTTDH